jgi:uncharacterized membrane protein
LGGLDPRTSKAVSVHASVVAGLSVVHLLRTRGLRRTLLFATLGNTIPVLGEHLAVNVLRLLRHRVRPQVGGVPVAIALGWYNVGYGTFVMVESLLGANDPREGGPSRALAPAAALAATSLDLLLDPAALDLGLWQWGSGGPYAAEIEGPNGERGVPLLNFAGWIGLISGVVLAYQGLDPYAGPYPPGVAGGSRGGRGVALLLLSYYLPAAAWAIKRRRFKYLLYSAPFAAVLWAALKDRS